MPGFWATDPNAPPPGSVPGLHYHGGQWKNAWGNAVDIYGGSNVVRPETGESFYSMNGVAIPDPNYHPDAYKQATGYDPPGGTTAVESATSNAGIFTNQPIASFGGPIILSTPQGFEIPGTGSGGTLDRLLGWIRDNFFNW